MRSFHRALATLSLHALGYDNPKFTGEKWFIEKFLPKQSIKVCVDVGANVGNYSALLLRALPEAQVHAVEPSTASFARLTQNLGSNGRVSLHKLALADANGHATFYSKEEASEKASLAASSGSLEETVEVKTLDTFMQDNIIAEIDFLKVDTEGFEKEVLMGSSARPKVVQFEFNIDHLRRGVTLLSLTELLPGYSFYRLLPHGLVRIDPTKFVDNIYMFSNIVALRQ